VDTRVELLEQFYETMRKDKLKLENKNYGFDFVNELTADGVTLDYGQLENNCIHKYRLLDVPEHRRKHLLQGHVNQEYNVCLYFDEAANNTLCFNLDNNYKVNNTEIIPEMDLAVKYLQQHLIKYGMEPLVIKSGRGYHQWCRFHKPIANQLLFDFMIRIAAKTLASLHGSNYDYHTIKFNMGPNPKVVNVVSLRAFGSKHIKTGVFSHINTKNGILNESDSWSYFKDYIVNKTISQEQFMLAYAELANEIPL
jgi:hypothetical protein